MHLNRDPAASMQHSFAAVHSSACTIPASAFTGQPIAALILSQCLSRSPGLRRAVMRGMCCWKSCSCSRTVSATCNGSPSSCFRSLALPRHHLQSQSMKSQRMQYQGGHVGQAVAQSTTFAVTAATRSGRTPQAVVEYHTQPMPLYLAATEQVPDIPVS